MSVCIYNPLPVALSHYESEVFATLEALGVEASVVRNSSEDLVGWKKLYALLQHMLTLRRLLKAHSQVLVLWPLLGWYELLLLGRAASGVFVVVHDPRPLRPQIGLARRHARLVAAVGRNLPTIVCHSSLAAKHVGEWLPDVGIDVIPHPMLEVDPQTGPARDVNRVGVFGQYKPARNLGLLQDLGQLLSDRRYRAILKGRGWPAIPGWEVEARFLSEEELDEEISSTGVVVIPYQHYYQSGVAIRAIERGAAVVGERHPFLVELLGEAYPGIVEPYAGASAWVEAIDAVKYTGDGPAGIRSRVVESWANFVQTHSWDVVARSEEQRARAWKSAAAMAILWASNLLSRRSIVVGSGPVVSLTSFGSRIALVHLAIESIGRGTSRPSRIILWLDDPAVVASPPRALRRLRSRGLELRVCDDLKSHKKYYPYVSSKKHHTDILVTADDDFIYPYQWLELLLAAADQSRDAVVCHRARRFQVRGGNVLPYRSWPNAVPESETPANFAVGFGGVLYPPAFLDELRRAGDRFLEVAPSADDVWLHANAVRAGRSVLAIGCYADNSFLPIRGARGGGLFEGNVAGGGNDRQIAQAYAESDLALIADSIRSEASAK